MKIAGITIADDGTGARVHIDTLDHEFAGENRGQRYIRLQLSSEVVVLMHGYEAAAARRALEIAQMLSTAAYDILAPVTPATSKENQADQLTDDDIPF